MSPTAWAKEQAFERREQESHLLTPGHHLAVLSAPGHYCPRTLPPAQAAVRSFIHSAQLFSGYGRRNKTDQLPSGSDEQSDVPDLVQSSGPGIKQMGGWERDRGKLLPPGAPGPGRTEPDSVTQVTGWGQGEAEVVRLPGKGGGKGSPPSSPHGSSELPLTLNECCPRPSSVPGERDTICGTPKIVSCCSAILALVWGVRTGGGG